MPQKAYSSFFFPQVSHSDLSSTSSSTSSFRGRSFLSFDNADSLLSKDDDDRSVFTTTTISSFFPGSAASSSSRRERSRPSLPALNTCTRNNTHTHTHTASRSSSHSSLRPIPQPKPAPRTIPPAPPVPFSAPANRTEYQYLAARPFTSPSKSRTAHRGPMPKPSFVPPSPPPSPQPRRMSTSTVSTRYRNVTRANALASLEGRAARQANAITSTPMSSSPIPLNARSFMPLSDTDDEDEDGDVDDEPDETDAAKARYRASTRRRRRGTIDSWFVGPPPSPSLSAVPSFLTTDSDESFESPRPSMSSEQYDAHRRNEFVEFEDVVSPKAFEYEYDAWEVVGETRPHWLKAVLE